MPSEGVSPNAREEEPAMNLAAKRSFVVALSFAAAVAFATSAHADVVKCKRGILKESGKFAQAKMKALAKCEEAKLKGKFPLVTNCHTEEKAAAAISKADTKMRLGVAK